MDTTEILCDVYDLIELIKESETYQNYLDASLVFTNPKLVSLLKKQTQIHETYLTYRRAEDLNALKEIKKKVQQEPSITAYYAAVSKMDDLLYEVACGLFDGVSNHLKISRFEGLS